MAQDEAEEERAFLADLKARTGRDLAQWMAAITAQGHADKNETIDWLRAQGFPFARASWLERIHSNGGRPIYMDADESARDGRARPSQPALNVYAPLALSPREAADRERLLAAGKGYQPLYEWLESEIRKALPLASFAPRSTYISIGQPREFAAVTLHKAGLRLGLDLGDRPFDAVLERANMRGPGPAISHMLVLTDARQVNDDLLNLIKVANTRVNG